MPALSEKEMRELKAAFTMLDANKDGRVNASELQSMLKRLGIHIQEEFTQELIKAASPSENGLINETEFLQWMGKLTCTSSSSEASADDVSEDLIAAFRVFDKDRNGFITKDELRLAMDLIGEPFTEAELNHMLELADIDKDGRINYEEFVRILM